MRSHTGRGSPRFHPANSHPYSGLMPDDLITLAHLSVSRVISSPNDAGLSTIGAAPRSPKRLLMPASASPALSSWLIRSMTSAGVPLGTTIPDQVLTS